MHFVAVFPALHHHPSALHHHPFAGHPRFVPGNASPQLQGVQVQIREVKGADAGAHIHHQDLKGRASPLCFSTMEWVRKKNTWNEEICGF